MLARCRASDALRLGLSGTPGRGQVTLIEALGLRLTAQGRRVAVLAVDPSSAAHGRLDPGRQDADGAAGARGGAFIRPSRGGTLGGVARRTREAWLLCEAAGFGVGCRDGGRRAVRGGGGRD
jgi:LAO/AO transport system kinase